jgi:hypothetical protein
MAKIAWEEVEVPGSNIVKETEKAKLIGVAGKDSEFHFTFWYPSKLVKINGGIISVVGYPGFKTKVSIGDVVDERVEKNWSELKEMFSIYKKGSAK